MGLEKISATIWAWFVTGQWLVPAGKVALGRNGPRLGGGKGDAQNSDL